MLSFMTCTPFLEVVLQRLQSKVVGTVDIVE